MPGGQVVLTTDVVKALRSWRQQQREDAFKRGRKTPKYVCTNRRGSPRRQDGNMRRVFQRVLVACNLDLKARRHQSKTPDRLIEFTPHSLRDTFASTHLTQNWGKLGWVSKQLGHSSPETTERHYFRFKPTDQTAKYADQIRGEA